MAANEPKSKKSPNYLKPYTDEQMLLEALIMYASQRQHFLFTISEPGYRNADGQAASREEIKYANQCVEQAERLVERAREKVHSPIVLLP